MVEKYGLEGSLGVPLRHPAGKSLLGRKMSRDFKSAVALLKVILLKD